MVSHHVELLSIGRVLLSTCAYIKTPNHRVDYTRETRAHHITVWIISELLLQHHLVLVPGLYFHPPGLFINNE